MNSEKSTQEIALEIFMQFENKNYSYIKDIADRLTILAEINCRFIK